MSEINLRSYGKINLSLDVIGLREDGYHAIETVMHRISLYDKVHINWQPKEGAADQTNKSPLEIQVKTNKPYLPTDQRNLAYKAATLMENHFGQKIGSGKLEISITKNIPVAAGLAGGSSNCAAVLIGLNQLWQLGLTTRKLCALGEELGSDIPFCILVQNTRFRCALATGKGEILHPVYSPMRKYLVLAKPAFGVSTKEVFKHIDSYQITERPDTQTLLKGLKTKADALVYPNMINVLERYTLDTYEPVRRLKKIFQQQTEPCKVLMSGSGPTVFGIYNTEAEAKKACQIIRSLKYEAYWASTMGR